MCTRGIDSHRLSAVHDTTCARTHTKTYSHTCANMHPRVYTFTHPHIRTALQPCATGTTFHHYSKNTSIYCIHLDSLRNTAWLAQSTHKQTAQPLLHSDPSCTRRNLTRNNILPCDHVDKEQSCTQSTQEWGLGEALRLSSLV